MEFIWNEWVGPELYTWQDYQGRFIHNTPPLPPGALPSPEAMQIVFKPSLN